MQSFIFRFGIRDVRKVGSFKPGSFVESRSGEVWIHPWGYLKSCNTSELCFRFSVFKLPESVSLFPKTSIPTERLIRKIDKTTMVSLEPKLSLKLNGLDIYFLFYL